MSAGYNSPTVLAMAKRVGGVVNGDGSITYPNGVTVNAGGGVPGGQAVSGGSTGNSAGQGKPATPAPAAATPAVAPAPPAQTSVRAPVTALSAPAPAPVYTGAAGGNDFNPDGTRAAVTPVASAPVAPAPIAAPTLAPAPIGAPTLKPAIGQIGQRYNDLATTSPVTAPVLGRPGFFGGGRPIGVGRPSPGISGPKGTNPGAMTFNRG